MKKALILLNMGGPNNLSEVEVFLKNMFNDPFILGVKSDFWRSVLAALIVKSGWGVLKDSLNILMEGSPKGVCLDGLVAQISGVDGVLSVHDLHVWSITSGANALTAHIVVSGELSVREAERILREISHEMEHLGITHTTLQLESSDNECADELICEVRSNGAGGHLGHSH